MLRSERSFGYAECFLCGRDGLGVLALLVELPNLVRCLGFWLSVGAFFTLAVSMPGQASPLNNREEVGGENDADLALHCDSGIERGALRI